MCRFDPDSVVEFLRTNGSYDLDECLACCQESGLRKAVVFLLDKKGDLNGAFRMCVEDIEAVNADLIHCRGLNAALARRAEDACNTAVSLCARSPRTSDVVWKDLLMAYVDAYAKHQDEMATWPKAFLLRFIKQVFQHAAAHGHAQVLVEYAIDALADVPVSSAKDVMDVIIGICSFELQKLSLASSIHRKDCGKVFEAAYRSMRKACSDGDT